MSPLKHSIFFRIYAGLVALVALVAVLAYFIVQLINYQRAQDYREVMADGVAHVISQVVARQPTQQSQQDWLMDVSRILELPLDIVKEDKLDLSRSERNRLQADHAIVRYNAEAAVGDVYVQVDGMPKSFLHIRVDKLSEVQIKMIPILILEDLVYYPGNEEQRLKELQPYFPYPIAFRNLSDLKLDMDQISRLRTDKTQTILLYRDSATMQGTTISAVSAYTNTPNKVLVLGPVPVFNWMPFRLVAGVTLFSLFMLSLGVYFLLRPLQHKIGKVRLALNQVRKGNLDTRVAVQGSDEIANLSLSFNMMTEHIQRLIEAQRELTRAVSHELRTPVARIRFGMEMLAETDDYDSRIKQTEMIDKDIEALNSLIDEIMTYAKLEQGTPSLHFEPVSIRNVLEQVIKETEVIKGDKKITSMLPAEETQVIAEYRYLHRVVQNFVVNALRHSDGTVHISGGIRNNQAYVCVEDDGAGIPEKDREKVFEAFARLDDSRTRASGDKGGYGLGLSIVSRIAYWFGGKVQVDDSPSLGGARFTMLWPISQNQAQRIDKKKHHE
ncbi:HAMP domain-containing protein [Acinetobacter qingfengensis]|uniref:histidine kinase n=1 Tax=Acinetobacter qingfengensis TaxID=1262585 RepID=A0A1E7RDN1_9GAMM|nr:ATP-binding protein [Acinetobacter qingfengensis]KAA8734481.1 HAMP domain-containing protein [Acinetobacter qingfengensis]OEY97519.1 two-component sensor histidine kinase [Acinetobacter qingfengensis]